MRQQRRGTRAASGPGSPLGRGAPSQTAGPRPARPPRGPCARPPYPVPARTRSPACCPAARGRPSAAGPGAGARVAASRAPAAHRPLGLFQNRLVGLSVRPPEGASELVTSLVARSAGGAGPRTRTVDSWGWALACERAGRFPVGQAGFRRPGQPVGSLLSTSLGRGSEFPYPGAKTLPCARQPATAILEAFGSV